MVMFELLFCDIGCGDIGCDIGNGVLFIFNFIIVLVILMLLT